MSDPVELVVTDPSFPPPGISLHPKECVGTGTNVTIHCWNKDYGAAFHLHKDGCSAPVQHQDSSGGGTANFTVFGVAPADAGTYRCSYRPWRYPFLSSPLGDSVRLELTPTPAHPGAKEWSHANLVIALVRGLVAALVFGLGVFFVIDARSLWRERDESCGIPSDSECLTCTEIPAVTPGAWPPRAAATAQPPSKVGTGGPH
ncbi:leukocyte immunoglobulin-like receptor subfamily A member 2 [Numida meleagris]|uniref:leukocyte immunoglobulin-like receptor subfamily A member 2 n=1 Tax=Numida meleagris TaxID=8996 RepID=UPI000B3D9F5D|nr:leukocyte immunoglobulin-like receptor subfamily A member 2 [Numida meleagris]